MNRQILLKIMQSVLDEDDIDYISESEWLELFDIIQDSKLMIPIGEALYKKCPLQYQIYLDEMILQAKNDCALYLEELRRLDALLKTNNISYALMKGMALSQQVYGDYAIRVSSDIDILVNPDSMESAYSLLRELGYRQHIYFDEKSNLVTIDKNSSIYGPMDHEIKCIKKLRIKKFIGVEVQKATTAIPLQYIDDFRKNIVNINIRGLEVQTTNILYTFLHLIANAYENSETILGTLRNCGVRDYFDIMMFLKKYHNSICWDEVEALSEKYRIKHIFCAILKNASELFKSEILNNGIITRFKEWSYNTLCTRDGYILGWESAFNQRVFNETLRIKESYWYLRNMISQKVDCFVFHATDALQISLEGNKLEVSFKWIYSIDDRFVISILNQEPDETLFSDIYLKKEKDEIVACFCKCSNIKGIINPEEKLILSQTNDLYKFSLDASKFVIDGFIYFKLLKQTKVINNYFIRIYLDKKYDFLNTYYKIIQE